ncbi:MAG: hypothetical protein K2J72_09200, partial [Oscillospiraceae bacterium]|nr:hypothetical protein [Oscillospiraceae bacterium]
PVFSGYELMPDDIYELMPDDISDYDAQIQWLMFNIATPKFYDENMNPTNNEFNGYNCMTGFSGQNAHILFNENPKIEEAKYVKWFNCTAEIPDMSE